MLLIRISVLLLSVWMCLQMWTIHILEDVLETQSKITGDLVEDNVKIRILLFKHGIIDNNPTFNHANPTMKPLPSHKPTFTSPERTMKVEDINIM